MKTKGSLFLTGATGLVGSFMLTRLLKEEQKVFALVRGRDINECTKRLVENIRFWNRDVVDAKRCNLVIVKGDITQQGLGVAKGMAKSIENEVNEIIHCAASTEFEGSLKELREVNVVGSKNVFDFGLKCLSKGKLKKVNYISSVYVCGDYKGHFKENDLDVGQDFNTNYERTKYEAEIIVRKYRSRGLWIDIYRAPAVVGESNNGRIFKFNQAFYQVVRVLSANILDYIPIRHNQTLNMVFVDELCESIRTISRNTTERNMTYHAFGNKSIALKKIVKLTCKYMKIRLPRLIRIDEFVKKKSTYAQRELLKNNLFFLNSEVRIDSKLTNELLNKYGFAFSKITNLNYKKLLDYSIRKRNLS